MIPQVAKTQPSSEPLYVPNAVLAINDKGKGFFMRWLESEEWMETQLEEYDFTEELDFTDYRAGLYYADMEGVYCAGSSCSGMNECAGDCFEAEWVNIRPKEGLWDE